MVLVETDDLDLVSLGEVAAFFVLAFFFGGAFSLVALAFGFLVDEEDELFFVFGDFNDDRGTSSSLSLSPKSPSSSSSSSSTMKSAVLSPSDAAPPPGCSSSPWNSASESLSSLYLTPLPRDARLPAAREERGMSSEEEESSSLMVVVVVVGRVVVQ